MWTENAGPLYKFRHDLKLAIKRRPIPEMKPDFAIAQHKCIKDNVAGQESHVVAHG